MKMLLVLALIGACAGMQSKDTMKGGSAAQCTPADVNCVTISFEVFKEELRTNKIAEVSIYKPAKEGDLFLIKGRYRTSAGDRWFQTRGVVDSVVIDQLKASGTMYTFQ